MLSGSSSDVTVTEEESFAKQQKKKANRKIQPGSVKQEEVCTEQTKQQHANERNWGSGSIEEEICAEQSKDEGKVECIICNNYKLIFRI